MIPPKTSSEAGKQRYLTKAPVLGLVSAKTIINTIKTDIKNKALNWILLLNRPETHKTSARQSNMFSILTRAFSSELKEMG